jgi:hypothetical protein
MKSSMRRVRFGVLAAGMLAAAVLPCRRAEAKAWSVAAGNWHVDENWNPAGVPGAGESVTVSVANAVITLADETANLGSFVMTAGKVVFTNWHSRIRAADVGIAGGSLTVASAFADTEMSNRVWIVCQNDFTLTAPGTINVDNLGYLPNKGPGAGAASGSYAGGSGHGGQGGFGYNNGGGVCDSLTEPVQPGSGGGNASQGGRGGGVVRIEAGGMATVNGTITANGQDGSGTSGGGGAGGTILVHAAKFAGNAAGLLQADGGKAGSWRSGDGGGGRIAVVGGTVDCPLLVRFATSPKSSGTGYSIAPSDDSFRTRLADWGTVYIADETVLAGIPSNNQFTKTVLQAGTATTWSLGQVHLTNNSLRLGPQGFQLDVAGDIMIGANAELGVMGSIACGGDLTLTNNGVLSIYGNPTNGTTAYGSIMDVANDVKICGNGAWLKPHTDPINGGGVLLEMRNLEILQINAGINASGRGYKGGCGPGKAQADGAYTGGGGYGGAGADSSYSAGGPANGNPYVPLSPGSGGGKRTGVEAAGFGGGLVYVNASGNVTLEGQILANGAGGRSTYHQVGAGSGGGILIACLKLTGSANAVLSAAGGPAGDKRTGAGGGGRIAVWYGPSMSPPVRASLLAGNFSNMLIDTNAVSSYQGAVSVAGGIKGDNTLDGDRGTVAFITPPPMGTIIVIR